MVRADIFMRAEGSEGVSWQAYEEKAFLDWEKTSMSDEQWGGQQDCNSE